MFKLKSFLRLTLILFTIYVSACLLLYFNQESILFHPTKLPSNHQLNFERSFEEITTKTADGASINGVLFKADTSSGRLIFFLHGNAGNNENQAGIADFYNGFGYDFFTMDYRGFGKSSGRISSEEQFYADARLLYRTLNQRYKNKEITIIGYSVGTATAAMLASENQPDQLILLAPYYSMAQMATHRYKIFPGFLVEYQFETFHFLKKVQVPITLFHGKDDGAIPYYSSKMLAGLIKKGDHFYPLEHQGHNGIESHPVFKAQIAKLLK